MLTKILLYALVAFLAPVLIPGVKVRDGKTAVLVAIVFIVLNAVLGPLLSVLVTMISLPAILLSFGLFALFLPALINAAMLGLTGSLLEGFELDGCFPAFLMGFCFALAGFIT